MTDTRHDGATTPQGEELFRLIAENARDFAIFAVGLDGRVASWNPGVEKLLGYAEDEWVGRNSCDIFTPEDNARGECQREMRAALEHGRAEDRRWHVRKDGTRFWADGQMLALRDGDGVVRGFAKIMRDETDRKATEEELRRTKARLESALEAGLAGTFYWDVPRDRIVTDQNMRRYFSLREEATGEGVPLEEVLPAIQDEDRELVTRALGEALESTGAYSVEYRVKHPEGVRWLSANGRVEHGAAGQVAGVSGFAVDITGRKRADAALREAVAVAERSRAQIEAVFQSVSDGIVVCDMAGNFIFANEAEARIVGYASARELERDLGYFAEVFELSHPDGRPLPFEEWPISKVLRGESVSNWELRGRRRDTGQEWFFSFSGEPVRDERGQQVMAVVVTRDITRRREVEETLRESEERYRSLASVLTSIIWTVDPEGRFITPQKGWEGYTGQTWEEHRDFGWGEAIHPEDRAGVLASWEAARASGRTYQSEGRIWHAPAGEYRWFVARAVPLVNSRGEVREWIGTVTDVHERRQAEEERERLLRESQEANRLKDDFLATLSHELRTPLTAILGWARLLQTTAMDDAAKGRAVATIERNAQAQTQLIEDLLDVSRIMTGKLRLDVRSVDLAAVVSAAADTARPAADAKEIRLQTLLDPQAGPVSGDPDRLQQVVWNLLSNAVKFTPKGGSVQVRLERVNSHVEITVADTGEGIAPEFLPHVFDRFRQADQKTTRKHGGLGLGLAIVRQLVELHGGSVRAESEGVGRGTTFTVSLPLLPVRRAMTRDEPRAHPRAAGGAPALACPPELEGLRVLVVDDEPDTRDILSAVLTSCGAAVTTAASAAEALAHMSRGQFDVLLSDIGMPEEDGYELIRKVRRLPPERGGKIPAAALTAYAWAEDRVRALRSGFQSHVTKPVEPEELVAVVENLAGRIAEG
jgi:PAS domain S-box-containing protein